MKGLFTIAISLLSFCCGFAQNPLGQTKSWIINKHQECYIEHNSSEMLVLDCDHFKSAYFLNKDSRLCDDALQEFPSHYLDSFMSQLYKSGYNYVNKVENAPVLILKDGSNKDMHVKGVRYTDGQEVIIVVKTDLEGTESDKFSIICFFMDEK